MFMAAVCCASIAMAAICCASGSCGAAAAGVTGAGLLTDWEGASVFMGIA
jgi:hypothetical protein